MSVLITGGSGLLGSNWAKRLSKTNLVFIGIHRQAFQEKNCTALSLDLDSKDDLVRQIKKNKITTVINTAAITSVEYCDRYPEHAFKVNTVFANNLAIACQISGAKLIQISTDQLYSGSSSMVSEKAALEPLNVYGRTKAAAEKCVAEVNSDALIIRTNFYGWGTPYRRSFSDWILDEIAVGRSPTLFTDVFYTPIYLGDLITIVGTLVEAGSHGIYNVVGSDRVSKFEFGQALLLKMGFDIGLIEPTTISKRLDLVGRPKDMSLLNEKLFKEIGWQALGLNDGLDKLLIDYKA
jgi:dTDP-4-dehydrorhamnose reductase